MISLPLALSCPEKKNGKKKIAPFSFIIWLSLSNLFPNIKKNYGEVSRFTPSSSGLAGCDGIFWYYSCFCKGCFTRPLGILNAFEAELLGVLCAIEYAERYNWNLLWLKCDFNKCCGLAMFTEQASSMEVFSKMELCNQLSSQYHVPSFTYL